MLNLLLMCCSAIKSAWLVTLTISYAVVVNLVRDDIVFFFSKYSSCLESVNSICLLWSIIFIGGYWQNLVAKNYEKLIILPPNYYMNEFITLLVPSLGRQSEANFWVQGQHDLQSSFRKFRTTQKKKCVSTKKRKKE